MFNEAITYGACLQKQAWRHKLEAELNPTPSMYYVYVLRNIRTKEFYYGYTNNLQRRFAQHNENKQFELIYYEAYKSEIDARKRERRLEHYAQALTALKTRLEDSLK